VLSTAPLLETSLDGLTLHRRGKVRDVYDVTLPSGDRALLIVATDRISAFDYVLGSGIPDKGKVLTQLSGFWFERMGDLVTHHLLSLDVDHFPEPARRHAEVLRGRTMLARRTEPIPIECVARGYLSGSGWKEYQQSGSVCGVKLPAGLRESDRLPEPIFTPATKADTGHDINISEQEAGRLVGAELVARLKTLTLEIYRRGCEHAESKGIIIADTKFEFGLARRSADSAEAGLARRSARSAEAGLASRNVSSADAARMDDVVTPCNDEVVLIDEVLTPDSSRFWPATQYEPGHGQPSFDKQFVRDYLEEIRWNKQPPVPALPDEVIRRTREKYVEAFRLLSGRELR
jgi:phosphoribosylaminoimidazole-succinocarboxamide synthase